MISFIIQFIIWIKAADQENKDDTVLVDGKNFLVKKESWFSISGSIRTW